MYCEMVKVFVSDWYNCLHPRGLGADWLPGYSDVIVPRKGWNKIPSIIPPLPEQCEAEEDSNILSDQDDALEPPPGISTEQDEVHDFHGDIVQMMAEE